MKAKASMSIFGKFFSLTLGIVDLPKEPTTGFTSRVPGTNRHIVPLDYDLIKLGLLKDELKAVQREFSLGDFHILLSRLDAIKQVENMALVIGGFHVVCLDEVTLYELREIQRATSCDAAFKWAPKYDAGRAWVLRAFEKGIREKPKYMYTLFAKTKRPQHLGMAKFLEANYGVPISFLQNSDGNEKISVEGYLTAKRVK